MAVAETNNYILIIRKVHYKGSLLFNEQIMCSQVICVCMYLYIYIIDKIKSFLHGKKKGQHF